MRAHSFPDRKIGGIDEIDAQLDCAPQNFLRVLAIRGPTQIPSPSVASPKAKR